MPLAKSVVDGRCESGVIRTGGNGASTAGPVGMEEFATRFVNALKGVGAKVITLRLQ
jgi:hypothetical protein